MSQNIFKQNVYYIVMYNVFKDTVDTNFIWILKFLKSFYLIVIYCKLIINHIMLYTYFVIIN